MLNNHLGFLKFLENVLERDKIIEQVFLIFGTFL